MIVTKFIKCQLIKILKRETNSNDPDSLTTIWALIVFIIGFVISHLVHNNFLSFSKTQSNKLVTEDRFIMPRALNDIEELIMLGPRVTGSVNNEVIVVNFLLSKINEIIHYKSDDKVVKFDHQTSAGGSFNRIGQTFVYNGIQNVVAKIYSHNASGSNDEPDHFILISTNFDSYYESLGFSDNGFGVSMLLELLRILSQSNDYFEHGILLVWNGAKESGLQGSHSFITKHKWANKIKTFVSVNTFACSLKEFVAGVNAKSSWMMKVRLNLFLIFCLFSIHFSIFLILSFSSLIILFFYRPSFVISPNFYFLFSQNSHIRISPNSYFYNFSFSHSLIL